jgi:hypothetical protein
MNMPRIPGFSAEASFCRSRAYYRLSAGLARPAHGGSASIQPAARRIAYCSMKGCCVDLRDLGFPRLCCNGDECGPDVLI